MVSNEPSEFIFLILCLYTEVARSIEDPYSWIKPCHDLTGVGWRLYSESLQLHEASVADVDAAAGHAADKRDAAESRAHRERLAARSRHRSLSRLACGELSCMYRYIHANHAHILTRSP